MIATSPLPPGIAPVEELLAAVRAGRACILIDAVDRNNEGAVIVPAENAAAADITFMALKARGLICLALTPARAGALRLRRLGEAGSQQPAFAASIEAREGVSTGISAEDRARTVRVACDPASGAADLVSPGHVFPVIAAAGGVLQRAGHTEAAVDTCALAGVRPAAILCKVLNDDGSMAHGEQLIEFGHLHDLPVGRIEDLIAYRREKERSLARVQDMPFATRHGSGLTLTLFRDSDDGMEHVALWRAGASTHPALLRIEAVDFVAGLRTRETTGSSRIDQALDAICHYPGPGALILLRQPGQQHPVHGDLAAKIALALGLDRILADGIGAPIAAEMAQAGLTLVREHDGDA